MALFGDVGATNCGLGESDAVEGAALVDLGRSVKVRAIAGQLAGKLPDRVKRCKQSACFLPAFHYVPLRFISVS